MPKRSHADQAVFDAKKKALDEFDAAIKLIDEGCFKIRAKAGGMIAFIPKPEQRKLYAHIRRQMQSGKYVRIIILKARQRGFSTCIAVLFLALSIVREAVVTLVVAHEKKSADKIFEIYRRALHHLPEDKQPETKFDSMRQVVFQGTESQIGVEIAVHGKLGRSDTVTYAHFSEFAWWDEQPETLQAALSAVPKVVGTISIIETTANGWGDTFHEMWLEAEAAWKNGNPVAKSDWEPFFAGWWDEKDYRVKLEEDFEMTTAEAEYMREFRLDRTQVNWRRHTLTSDCGGDVRLFDREFPTSPAHAFAATGDAVFDPEAIEWQHEKFCCDPEGEFEVGITVKGDPYCNYRHGSPFRVYRRAQEGHEYVIAADPTHNQGLESDDAAFHVIDGNTREVVASWNGPIGAHEFGDVLVGAAKIYNHAYIIVESNIGKVTIERVVKGIGYGHIHYYQVSGVMGADPTWQMGFSTNSKTRGDMIHLMKRLVREHLVAIYDKATLLEMREFKEIEKGDKKKAMAPKGKQDNLVMALMIGCYVAEKRHRWLGAENYGAAINNLPTFHRGFVPPKERKEEIIRQKRNAHLVGLFGTHSNG